MIELTLAYGGVLDVTEPFACRVAVGRSAGSDEIGLTYSEDRACTLGQLEGCEFTLPMPIKTFRDGEVWLVFPSVNKIQRLYRPNANSNTILLTERCDQLCIMCSQPPKAKDYVYSDLYISGLNLIREPALIGISGGEPTLYMEELLRLVRGVESEHVGFHILTNGQHFEPRHIAALGEMREKILWGIPLYSHIPENHDAIVGKSGAHATLLNSLSLLMESASSIELRTVLLQQNITHLLGVSEFISQQLSWITQWSLMQLEPFGYAKIDWASKFIDTSEDFTVLAAALDHMEARGICARLFNFPLCTIPAEYRGFSEKSISDWKNKYLDLCKGCDIRKNCGGFFEWYNNEQGYQRIGLQPE